MSASLLDDTRCANCGHVKWAHKRALGPGPLASKSACTATIYESAPHGQNAYQCPCERWEDATRE